MTIQSAISRKSYVGDGVSTVFTVPFPFFQNSDLSITQTDTAGGVTTISNAVIAGAGNPSGGTVTLIAPLTNLYLINIFLAPGITQLSHYISNAAFPAATLETDLDKSTQVDQYLQEQINNSIRVDVGEVAPNMKLPGVAARKSTNLGFDANGNIALSTVLNSGTLSQAAIGAFLYPLSVDESAAAVTPSNFGYPAGDIRRYGAVMDGVTDDAPAFAKLALVMGQGASGYLPPFPMMLKSQVTIVAPAYQKIDLYGYGCTIFTTGAIYAIQVTGGFMGGLTLRGVMHDNSTDTLALGGFNLHGCQNCVVYECEIRVANALGHNAGYGGVVLDPTDPTNNNTGAFWNRIIRLGTRQSTGNPTYYVPAGVLILGACNATQVVDCNFTSVNQGVFVLNQITGGGTGTLCNALLVSGNAFESCVYGIAINGQSFGGSHIEGLRIVNNRFESQTSGAVLFQGLAADSSVPAWMSGNFYVSSTITYITQSNVGGLQVTVNNWEPSLVPSFPQALTFTGTLTVGSTTGTLTANWGGFTGQYSVNFSNGNVLQVTLTNGSTAATAFSAAISGSDATANATINIGAMQDQFGTGPFSFGTALGDAVNMSARGGWGWALYSRDSSYTSAYIRNRSGGGAVGAFPQAGDWRGIDGISKTQVQAKNLRGTATFSAATSVVVSITTETDSSYFIALSGNLAGFCWVTAKGTTSFTINCSASNSNAVDWMLIR